MVLACEEIKFHVFMRSRPFLVLWKNITLKIQYPFSIEGLKIIRYQFSVDQTKIIHLYSSLQIEVGAVL